MTTISNEVPTLPNFDKAELSKIYDRHFCTDQTPEEMLQTMMLRVLEGNPDLEELRDRSYDYMILNSFFRELFKPIRTPDRPTA